MDEVYKILLQLGLFTIVVEGGLKAVFDTKAYRKYIKEGFIGEYISKPLFAIIVSLVLCFQAKFDVLAKLIEGEASSIGIVLTALVVSRGSNGLSDFLRRKKALKDALNNVEVEKVKNGEIKK